MKWSLNLVSTNMGYMYGYTDNYIKYDNDIYAMFDLDDTLITTISGKKSFMTNENDWKFLFPNTVTKLYDLHLKKYNIVIITNQGWIKNSETNLKKFKLKIEQIEKKINVPFSIYVFPFSDIFRKPHPTIFYKKVFHKKSFYCGDAYDSVERFSDTDLKFAFNLGIQFYTEKMFINDRITKISIKNINYPINQYEYVSKEYVFEINKFMKKEFIIMVGYQGSGKSTICKNILNVYQMCYLNADTYSKKDYNKQLLKSIVNKEHIIIDNTNMSNESRTKLIDYVRDNQEYYVRVIYMTCPIERSIHNMHYRSYTSYVKDNIIIPLIPKVAYNVTKKKCENIMDKRIDIIENVDFNIPFDMDYGLFYL
jgi:DNA 3'-phosphatase